MEKKKKNSIQKFPRIEILEDGGEIGSKKNPLFSSTNRDFLYIWLDRASSELRKPGELVIDFVSHENMFSFGFYDLSSPIFSHKS